jgi:hypothetical protein
VSPSQHSTDHPPCEAVAGVLLRASAPAERRRQEGADDCYRIARSSLRGWIPYGPSSAASVRQSPSTAAHATPNPPWYRWGGGATVIDMMTP